jgi:hypothetical protein
MKKPNKKLKIKKIKLIIMKKNPTWKRMRCIFFLQTSNLHPNKQKYKSEKKHFIFIIQNNNKNKKHIKKRKK